MNLENERILVTLKNGEKYMISKDHNDDLYEIEDNHLYQITCERKGFFVFKHWEDTKIDLGEIDKIEDK